MSYRKLGVVGKHYDDHKNLLKRQLAAAEYISPKIWVRDYQCRREHHKINRSSNKRLGEVRKANSYISFTSSSSDINDRVHFEQREDILLDKLREKQCLDILSFYAGPHLAARQ